MSIANPTLEDVWQLFRETAAQQQETASQQRENAIQYREIAERQRESDRQFQEFRREAELSRKEIERFLKEQSQETDRKLQETAIQVKKTSEKVSELSQKTKELENLFTSQWGRLIESLVEGALVRIFNEWNLPVKRTSIRVKGSYKEQNYEFDILVHNGDAVIIVEVKTTLRPQHVKHFIKKLDQAKIWLQEYSNNQIYGAMAFLHADAGAEQMVIKQNLFAICATGDSAHIVNTKGFAPRVW